MKRVLLITEDQLVSNYYRLRFESMGITVDAARSNDSARRMARDRNPDLTVIDPIMTGLSPIALIEGLRDCLGSKEMWIISRLPNAVGKAMEKAGANRVQGRGGELEGSLFIHVAEALGLPAPDSAKDRDEHDAWVHSVCEAAPEAINNLRVSLHDFVKDPRAGTGLYELFRQAHQLSHRVGMLHIEALGRLTSSLEGLIYDLYAMPEQINPSIVRTVSQAIDFLVVLFEEKNVPRLKDPASADVFVVDDEPPARQMIAAAMRLVGLKITCADDSEMALSVLGDNTFDLIFLDVHMPNTNGFELCTQIRQLEDHHKTPIVFITGMNTFQNRAQGSLSGGNDFIGKPFNLLELGIKALMWIFKGQLAAM
ncbi:MAG TPA: response regulator [Chthoniobacteraceae bacterium]|jgi:DNA-binding response OmpR family regulator|nr:response regulator [Chthoniobacteraceae bacterium]